MTDTFKTFARSLTSPPEHAAEIAPSDAAILPFVTRALYVGGGGDVALRLMGGAEVTFRGLQAGSLIPIRIDRVRSSRHHRHRPDRAVVTPCRSRSEPASRPGRRRRSARGRPPARPALVRAAGADRRRADRRAARRRSGRLDRRRCASSSPG